MRTITKHKNVLIMSVLCVAPLVAIGCTATRERRGEPAQVGFLGDYSQLEKNPEYAASLVYLKPGVDWSRYDAIQLDSAGLWLDPSTQNISPEDQQKLTDELYATMYKALSADFKMVTQAGPNTLRIRVALTQAQGAKVVARVITTVIPQLRILTTVGGLAADTAVTVGSATAEMEVLDALTNQRLAAAVDDRAGTKALFAKRAYTTWGDVDAACNYWSSRLAWRLAKLGVRLKPGVAMPEEPSEPRSI